MPFTKYISINILIYLVFALKIKRYYYNPVFKSCNMLINR